MSDLTPPPPPVAIPLTPLPPSAPITDRALARQVIRMAVRTARLQPGRVFIPALFIFGFDAANSTLFTEISLDRLGDVSVGAGVVLFMSTIGLTFYSGLLERLVGAIERGDEAPPIKQVIKTLPYVRLILADAILWLLSGVASLTFVIPGLIVTTLFALIGPLINMEDLPLRKSFRRSATLVAPKFLMVLCLVTIPVGIEHELVTAAAVLDPHEHIWLVYLTYLLGGLTFGVALGLMEVSLAERLVYHAQGPGQLPEVPLPSDEQGGHHGRDDSRDGHAGAGTHTPTG